MANVDLVARALNRFSDSAFLSALRERDLGAMTDLVEEFFCSRLDEQEEGMQKFINCNSKNSSIKKIHNKTFSSLLETESAEEAVDNFICTSFLTEE